MSSCSLIPSGALAKLIEVQSIGVQDVEHDQDEEVESLAAGIDLDDRVELSASTGTHYLREPTATMKKQKIDPETWKEHLKKASEHVVVDNTLNEYRRYWTQFTIFCVDLGFVDNCEIMETYQAGVPEELPSWVAVWIMHKADELDIYTGKPKDPTATRVKYGTAQKMRAAISHKFGREFGFGEQPWVQNAATGKYSGNPSLSVVVSQYMISLQRRKVRAGEDVTSARAITEQTIKLLYEFNTKFPKDEDSSTRMTARKRKAEHPEDWAGYRVRQMLQLLYILSMLCLLRFDEALRIMWTDITTFQLENGVYGIKLELPFRKTAQYGGKSCIAPFYLYQNKDHEWLCPVKAYALWWKLCDEMNVGRMGYVFRKRIGRDDISVRASDSMSNDSFLECFRNNLLDISIDPRSYGTHSFRRGGCQYLAMALRWPIRHICTWGGWAENFDNTGTIFKYLLSWVDAPLIERKDYFNPKRALSDPCNQCGRTCICA